MGTAIIALLGMLWSAPAMAERAALAGLKIGDTFNRTGFKREDSSTYTKAAAVAGISGVIVVGLCEDKIHSLIFSKSYSAVAIDDDSLPGSVVSSNYIELARQEFGSLYKALLEVGWTVNEQGESANSTHPNYTTNFTHPQYKETRMLSFDLPSDTVSMVFLIHPPDAPCTSGL